MRPRRPMRPLQVWTIAIAISILCPILVAAVVARMHATDAELESAHLQGMFVGSTMCGAR